MFINREDAARQLGQRLAGLQLRDPIVLAIPRGGVVIGATLAKELDAELDVVLARKLRAPFQPELALGAVGEDGTAYVNPTVAAAAGADETYLARGRSCTPLTGRTVILPDDGIATGSTMIAALHVVNSLDPLEVIVAVPVAPADRLAVIKEHCDRVICLKAADDFQAVGQYYASFAPVEEEDVATLLKQFQRTPADPQ
ncbi:MAG TPA: phosphoribosyltransferase family protein [Lacipirellulaceae bacterium]|nr:phosphoribosyltransferase family protein [Lacipirellulaceae bacterium]